MMFDSLFALFTGGFLLFSYETSFVQGNVGNSDAAVRFEPQVAVGCRNKYQYYSQYMTEDGKWTSNPASKTACVEEKMEILKFCKQSYPNREITNIVEASKYIRVPNFCRAGRSNKCKTSIFVKPYRCLEGSFQSDALLVPEGCLFDHIHNQSRCWEFDEWNTTADQACQARHLSLKAFAMLLPCGIDVFSGVEFVCCPSSYKNHGQSHATDIEEPLALPQVDRHLEDTSRAPVQDTTTPHEELGTRDAYYGRFDPEDEHEAFQKALRRNKDKHREDISKVMKEWSELEERYQSLRDSNPKRAEEFKHRMTQEFQQTVQKVEAENEAEKQQLTALHQQRIVAHINEMKREAMSCYTRALSESEPNTHKVQKCLQKLLRALNKDRHHTVAHFKHLLNSDYEAADRERDSTLQHLADIDRMVNQSLNMLARKPELYAKIGHMMREYASALHNKDITPPELTPAPAVASKVEDDEDDSDETDDYDDDDDSDESDEESDDEEDEDEDENDSHSEGLHSATATEEAEPVNHAPATATQTTESADAVLHRVDEPRVAHARHHEFSHSQPGFRMSSMGDSASAEEESRSVYFTLAFAGMALMGAMVVGIMVLRRKSSRNPQNQGFIEVNQSISPEERHVTNMQVNGYENPTYKYFEEK